MRLRVVSVVLFLLLSAEGAWAKSNAPLGQRLEQLSQEIGAHELRAPPRDNEDIERAGVFRPNALLNRSRDLPFQPNRDQNAHNCCHQNKQHW